MNIHHLKYFYDSARLGSISKAAEVNFVGQPAISKAIKSLELELGVKLILHEKNRFNLTDAGTNAFEHSLEVFRSVEKLRDYVDKDVAITGEVRFSCQSSMAESLFLARAVKLMGNKYPGLLPNLSLGRTDLVRTWLRDGITDFCIVINNTDFREFNSQVISSGNFSLLKGKSYKGDWRQEGILTTEPTVELDQLRQKFLALNKYPMKSKMVIGSWGVIKNFALQGFGVGFLPDYLVQKEVKTGHLVFVEKQKYSMPYEILLITPKNKYISSKVRAVIRLFTDEGV